MNASQRRIAIRALPKQGSKVGYHSTKGLIDVRVGGFIIKDNGRPSLTRIKVTNPATRGRATPKLSQLVY
jgi:hypothetical protein